MSLFLPTKIRIKTDLKFFLFLCRYLFQLLFGRGNTYMHKFLWLLLNMSLQRLLTSNLDFGPCTVVVVQLFLHYFYTSCRWRRSRCFLFGNLVKVTELIVQIKYIQKHIQHNCYCGVIEKKHYKIYVCRPQFPKFQNKSGV